MEDIEIFLNQLQTEMSKSMEMLTKTDKPEERKLHSETILALTKSLESYSNAMMNLNETMLDLDEEDDLDFFGDNDIEDDDVIRFSTKKEKPTEP